jgi:hypothetical protein
MKSINFTKEEKESLEIFLESLPIPNMAEMRKVDKTIEYLEKKEIEDEYFDFLKNKIENPPQGVAFNASKASRKIWLSISDKLK